MDVSTIGGLILAFLAMFGALFLMAGHGGEGEGAINLAGFIDPPAILMVLGGAAAVALVGFPLHRVLSLFKVVKLLFFRKKENLHDLIDQLVRLAEVARRDGLLALENKASDINHPFVALGIQMAVDGVKPDTVEDRKSVV